MYDPPTPLDQALDQVAAWMESPSLVMIAEGEGYWERLSEVARGGRVTGGRVHDARIAALCLHHRVDELWSADRDLSRFPELRIRNPLMDSRQAP
ncbi:MAG: PIN domain-containing protein [Gemmatimonadota bacterium]